jgi:hypothetical protein
MHEARICAIKYSLDESNLVQNCLRIRLWPGSADRAIAAPTKNYAAARAVKAGSPDHQKRRVTRRQERQLEFLPKNQNTVAVRRQRLVQDDVDQTRRHKPD